VTISDKDFTVTDKNRSEDNILTEKKKSEVSMKKIKAFLMLASSPFWQQVVNTILLIA